METRPQLSTSQCSTPSRLSTVEDDFQFVLCEGCQQELPNLKLLTCLHTLCLNCLSENKPIGQCPVCRTAIPQASGIPNMENLLFINLQARLKVYKKISNGSGPNCSRCRGEPAASWCSECEEFLCTKCFEDHQWFFKKRNHEAKRVEELRAESAHQFLEDTRKSCNLFCSTPGHASQGHISSIYCNKCEKALCCICALLDSQHGSFCDIRSETQRRQEELSTMVQELKQKRSSFEATYSVLQDEAARLEQAQREMRELIRERVEHLVQLIRREEEELLVLVETQQEQGRQDLARELEHMEGMLRRMEASERLVEKMNLYATEQEVMDMQPFIKKSLEDLQCLQPAATGDQVQRGNFAECRARLQALVERVTGHSGTSGPQHDSPSEGETTLILEPPGEQCQSHGGVPTDLPAHHQPCIPVLEPSGSREHVCPDKEGTIYPTQSIPPAILMQKNKEAVEDSASAHEDTAPLPRSIQHPLASLQKDLSGWARSNMQQADKLLKISNCLLQAQCRANRHLVSMTQELQAMSRSLADIASAVRPLLQSMAGPQDPATANVEWSSLPSDLLELFPHSTLRKHELLVPASTPSSPSRPPPASPPASPVCSEPPSSHSEGECSKSRHSTRGKRGGKPSTRLRKRRKK